MVFCNEKKELKNIRSGYVTILILIDGFLQYQILNGLTYKEQVTILILIDGFLQ